MAALLLRVFGALLLLTALALPLMRAPDRPVQTLVARWAPPPSDFVDLDGQLVHVRDEGPRAADPARPTLVLLHGTSASLHTWEGWARVLRRTHRVISLDLPGFGLTGPWSGRWAGQPYRAEAYVRFLLPLLERLDARGPLVLAGNSLGGEVAWRLAQAVPARVAGLVLVDASGYRFTPEAMPLGWHLARHPLGGWLVQRLLPRPLVVQGLATVMGDPQRITDAQVDRYFELTLREGNRRAMVERARDPGLADAVERIEGVRAPTLVIWGGRDRVIPPALAERFVADIPGARLQRFAALGHIPQEEDPAATLAPVQAFLAGLAAPAR